ncbi:PVC-type heme-binding CxxCH protein [Cyclobacterium sp.]|uniref:PVC-type heme-binding CxxCH protein n=1 Tax=Cyclobacterium sp. TaxID=1966343 RepID=UPI00198BD133|nr:PVC-type heme-binding CxxCH protein [Cyclobacterium sp.]MBD3626767.1 HEAT repeat domain-containing protein [Cyclobacterium sp.]
MIHLNPIKTRKSPAILAFSMVAISIVFACGSKNVVYQFDPEDNSTIVFIGNTFADRLQNNNYFETLLYQSFPDRNLKVRNLAWNADEVNLRPRPLHFGTLDDHLQQQRADVIFAFFGLNESFNGPDSLVSFTKNLNDFLSHLQQQQFNGENSPQIILVSPIAHEDMGGFLPDPKVHNENLSLYTDEMRKVASSLGIPFIDLYQPSLDLMQSIGPLTSNGIHPNDTGYLTISEYMAGALDFPVATWEDNTNSRLLREAIAKKNQHFFYRFKAQNGEYIYGRRKDWSGGEALKEEIRLIDTIIERLDSVVWSGSAKGSLADLDKAKNIIGFKQGAKSLKDQTTTLKELEKAKSQFVLKEGYEIELYASELDFPIANPVAITFDPQGRMWVSSMPSYPQYTPGDPPMDKLIILEDTNLDGKADKYSIFADCLYLPLGFELGDGGVYVTQAPDLVHLKDTDGDGRADSRNILFSGLGTEDSHHSLSAFTWGQDGALYFHMGTFLHSQIETPYGPKRGAYGTTWRYEPYTMKLEANISYPYANPWGNVFMRDGTHLVADVSTGMNYFAPPLTVAIDYPKKHMVMKDFLNSQVKPKTCGIEIISSRAFPEKAQGNVLFNTFIGFQGVRQHVVSNSGSGIQADETSSLLQSKDPNFRPVDLKFGPDGALYVVDWYDPIIQHGEQNFRDSLRDSSKGRIWRITYKDKKTLKPVDMTQLGIRELLDQLKVYEDRERYRARIQLREFDWEVIAPALDAWINQLDPKNPESAHLKLEALWVYQQFNQVNLSLLEALLDSPEAPIRAAATRVLYYWKDEIENTQQKLIAKTKDPSPRVRLESIAALSHFENEATVNSLLEVSALPTDDYLDYALMESFKHLKPIWMEMFKTNKEFLANEPQKAARLLRPLASRAELQVPGFIKADPNYEQYGVAALSEKDLEELAGVTAVEDFKKNHLDILFPEQDSRALQKTADKEKGELIINLGTLPGKMLFDKEVFEVPAGKTVSILFDNKDQMPHNVLILEPGAIEKVGVAADNMASLDDGYEKNFIPEMKEVLFFTPLVNSNQAYQLDFTAPDTPGDYPFICTFPGHWRTMRGIMKVT